MTGSNPNPEYEAGMRVIYDAQSQRVIVNFRGRVVVVPGSYEDEHTGKLAGEAHCRTLGWAPNTRQQQGQFRSAWN